MNAIEATDQIEEEANAIVLAARTLPVTTAQEYEAAAEFLKRIKGYAAKVKEAFDPMVKAAHEAWKVAAAQRTKYEAPAFEAEQTVKLKLMQFQAAEEKKRQEAQAKAEEAARKEAEKAREAEARRLEREAKKIDRAMGPEVEAAEYRRQAEEVRQAELAPAPVVVESQVPKVVGIVTKKVWNFDIVDVDLLPRRFMVPDEEKIRKVVKALRLDHGIPGVEAYEETVMSAGRT